jgi:hypothetical protein
MSKCQCEGIVSLLDLMRQFNAVVFCHLGTIIETYLWDKPGSGMGTMPAPPFDKQSHAILFPLMNDLQDHLAKIELHASASTCALIKARIRVGNMNRAQLDGLLGELHRNFSREASQQIFLKIDKDKTVFYRPTTVLSELTRMTFPDAESDLREAATSYAVGLNTASVFYSMRSLEKPIHALAKKLRVKLSKHIDLATWGEIHTSIKTKTDRMRNKRHTKARDKQLKFYSDAGAEFGFLKDSWRNYVSHARETYNPLQALQAFQHSMAFIENLAPRI